jgi:hypothetical protein
MANFLNELSIDFVGHATTLMSLDKLRIITAPHLLNAYRHGLFSYWPEDKPESLPVNRPNDVIHSLNHPDLALDVGGISRFSGWVSAR